MSRAEEHASSGEPYRSPGATAQISGPNGLPKLGSGVELAGTSSPHSSEDVSRVLAFPSPASPTKTGEIQEANAHSHGNDSTGGCPLGHGLPPGAMEMIRKEIAEAVSNESTSRAEAVSNESTVRERDVEELRQVVQLILGQYLLEMQLDVKALRKRFVDELGAESENRCARNAEIHDRLGRELSCVNSRLALETSRLEQEIAEVRVVIDRDKEVLANKVHEESHFRIRRIGHEFSTATSRLEEEIIATRTACDRENEAFRNKLQEESNLRLREAELMRASLDSMWCKLQGSVDPTTPTSGDAVAERQILKDRPPIQTSMPQQVQKRVSFDANQLQVGTTNVANQPPTKDWTHLAAELAVERRERKLDVNAALGLVEGIKSQVKKLEETVSASMKARTL